MLTDHQWNEVRHYTEEVMNRETDFVLFSAGHVYRDIYGGVTIRLGALQADLEPEHQDRTSGVGWPE